jgi:trk system potassium uptake protein TrkH
MERSKIAVLKTGPETVVEDYGRLLKMADFEKHLPRDKETILKINISWHYYFPACSTTPWQLDGVTQALKDAGYKNLIPYQNDILLNLTTCGLIIFGGLGFFVIKDILYKRSFRKLSLHSKVVLLMTGILLLSGTLLLKATENISWLGAFFFSTSARTAGFSTYALSGFSNACLFVLVILMFIGASPGSTCGGIKTTTFFTLVKQVYATATNQHCSAFKRKIPNEIISKAFILVVLAGALVCINTLILCILEPQYTFMQLLFETMSAFGTVGLSTGITPHLSAASKLVIIITMFIGRLGPLTMASIWSFKPQSGVSYSEESITIG